MTELPIMDLSFVVHVFSPGDDLIACLNKAMDFLTAVAWYKDKAMLIEAQEARKILDEEKLAFLTDPGVPDGQAIHTITPNNAAFQTEDLDTYDSTVMMYRMRKQFSWPTFSTMVLTLSQIRVKMFDSQMDDMIKEKFAQKEQVNSLEKNPFNQIKENKCLLQTFTVFKSESKAKKDKYMENEIDFEKKIKGLDNFLFKVGQSAHTVHMLTKPQDFYDNIHKQALASKTKSLLWHRRLSHLNFGTLNKLAKDGLARGIPRLKFQKDHLCSACVLGKSKKSSHQPKAKDNNQEKLYLLHMDLCGPMRMESINEKRDDWDYLFQPMFDEYFNPPTIAVSPVPVAATPRAVDLADSPGSSSNVRSIHALFESLEFMESLKTPHFHDDPLLESLYEDSTSQGSSSNVRSIHALFESLGRWTKDHAIANVIGDPSRSVSTRKQL
nr:Gag-Pol polyprotein [Tanacetum cinerariifolium]